MTRAFDVFINSNYILIVHWLKLSVLDKIINTFFANSPDVNYKQEYEEMLNCDFTQCVFTGHKGVGHSFLCVCYELLVIFKTRHCKCYIVCN